MSDLVDPEKLVGLAQLAEEYGYNGEHLRQLVAQKKLKAWFIANTWITTREHLEAYMRARQTEGWPQRLLPGRRKSDTKKSQKSHKSP